MKQFITALICLGFAVSVQARSVSKSKTRVHHRANCACEYINIDGKIPGKKRVYGFGSRAKSQINAQRNCKKFRPSKNFKSRAVSCVFDRVKVDRNGNVVGMKRVLEEEAVLASDLDALL